MVNTRIDNDKGAEIVPLIGIPRKWVNPTLKCYSFIFLGYTIWVTYQEFGSAAKTFKAKLTFLVPHLGAFSVFEAITIIAFIQVWADWYHRQENARAQGVPFDEPPPSLNGDKTKG